MEPQASRIPDVRSDSFDRNMRRLLWLALAVLLLTSVHHAYGAYVYDTPWRLHVVFVAGLMAALLLGSFQISRRRSADLSGRVAFWTFAAVVLVMPVAAIGLFEGGFNHLLKDALYFAGASADVMQRLFPPPAYELPNDVFFEVTGVQQLVLGALTGYQLFRLVGERRRGRAEADLARAAA